MSDQSSGGTNQPELRWECARCGATGTDGIKECPDCESMEIGGEFVDDIDLPPCWKRGPQNHGRASRVYLHLDGPGFIGVVGDTAELVTADIEAGEDPDPETRDATPENIRKLAEQYNDEFYGAENDAIPDSADGKYDTDTYRSTPEEILDATTGGRGIWCDGQKENERTLFIDKRERDPGFCGQPNRYYQVQPDEIEDFRDLPYSDESFDLVVFDPPHTIRENGMADLKGHVTKKYGALHAETWQDDLRRGFLELFRVLRPGGTLIFKFADEAADFEEVLELAPEPPLFGTRTKQSKQVETRWFVFHKQRSVDTNNKQEGSR